MSDVLVVLKQAQEVISALSAKIAEMDGPAQFGLAVMDDGSCYGMDVAAKMLAPKILEQTGQDIGRNRMMEALRNLQILEDDNQPYQRHRHHFKIVPKKTAVGMKYTTLFTGAGLAWALPKLIEYYR